MMTASPTPKRVLVHGFGEYAVIYHHLMQMASKEAPELSFAVILPTSHHLELIRPHVPPERLLCLEQRLARTPPPPGDLSDLSQYHGSIHADIEAEKKTFKHRPAAFQTARAVEIYRLYKAFLLNVKPDHALLSHVEGYEQKMLESLCHELGIPVSVPTDLRTIGGSFMSPDTRETLPGKRPVTPELRARAETFVKQFRLGHMPPVVFNLPREQWGARLSRHRPPFRERLAGFVRRSIKHPDQFEWDFLRAAFLNNVPALRNAWWALRARRAARWHDLDMVDQLPTKFIYYPLQVTPESSINTPAPYFIDQLRVIDAIRHAMPSDHLLVVKDHAASIMVRPKSLLDAIRSRSGIAVMRHDMHGRELIKRAAVTVSVTGTSTLEAFLLGRPSLALGGMFASGYFGGVTPLSRLAQRLRQAISSPPKDAAVIKAVAEVMAVARPFSVFALQLPGDPVYSEGNIRELLAALKEAMVSRPA
jgi:Capsule polysaccharide biosynthesis protein